MKNKLSLIQGKLKELISKSKSDRAIQELKQLLDENSAKLNQLILLENRNNEIQQQFYRNEITEEERTKGTVKVNQGLLKFIDELNSKDIFRDKDEELSIDKIKKKKYPQFIILLLIVILGGGFIFQKYFNSSSSKVRVGEIEDSQGNSYPFKEMEDGRIWMTKNLNLKTNDSWCYENNEENCKKFGRLYTWQGAKNACLALGKGWYLPTDDEWLTLCDKFGGAELYKP